MATLAFLVDKYSSETNGGTERFISTLYYSISENSDFDSCIIISLDEEGDGFKVQTFLGESVDYEYLPKELSLFNNCGHRLDLLKNCLIFLEKNCRVQILNTVSVLHFEPNFWLKIAFHNFQNSLDLKYLLTLMFEHFKYRKAIKRNLSLSDRYVLLSDIYAQKSPFKTSKNVRVIGNPTALRSNHRSFEKSNIILIVSRLDLSQRDLFGALDLWLTVQNDLSDYSLKILGSGPDEFKVRSHILRKKIARADLLGEVDPIEFYQKARFLIHFGITDGWGLAITEAQSFGVYPIVIDRCPIYHELIKSQKEGLILPKNIKRHKDIFLDYVNNVTSTEDACCSWEDDSRDRLEKWKEVLQGKK